MSDEARNDMDLVVGRSLEDLDALLARARGESSVPDGTDEG
jgi:hypothetical protein